MSDGKGCKRHQKLVRQVREAKMKKREAFKEFNEAKSIGFSQENIQSIVRIFFQHLLA